MILSKFVNCKDINTASIPTIQPFTANERNGPAGSKAGVRNAPARIAIRPKPKNGKPPSQASLNKIPDGCNPKIRKMIKAIHLTDH